jgi:hypothetical protein
MDNHERYIAIREGWVLNTSDEYFGARQRIDTVENRNMFEAGAERMYNRLMEEQQAERDPARKQKFIEQYVLARASRLSEVGTVAHIVQDGIEAYELIHKGE